MLLDLGMFSPDGRTFLQKKAPKLFRGETTPKDPQGRVDSVVACGFWKRGSRV